MNDLRSATLAAEVPADEEISTFRKRMVRTLRFLLLLALVGAAVPAAREGTLSWRFWWAAAFFFASNVVYHFERTDIFRTARLGVLIFLFDSSLLAYMMSELGERSNEYFILFATTILMAAMAGSAARALICTVAVGALYSMLTLRGLTGVNFLSLAFTTRMTLLFVLSLFVATLGREAEQARLEARRAVERLRREALYDALTGLPKRALFMDRIELALGRTERRDDYRFAVLSLHLDSFKKVVDSLGHTIGDRLLAAFARVLEECVRPPDLVARLDGEEFGILLDEVRTDVDPAFVADRIRKRLADPFRLEGREVFAAAHIGIAPGAPGYERPEDLLRDANTAMHRAKVSGGTRHEMFDPAMHARAVELLSLETDLRRALDRNELRVHYQPVVSLSDGRLEGFEALVRWAHPQRGLVLPDAFIPVAEDNGLIGPIGAWVLRESCRQARAWQVRHTAAAGLNLSVNLSARQFAQTGLVAEVEQILAESSLDPARLRLEITESDVMSDPEAAAGVLMRLKALKLRIYIDDFGTGYSSLSHLHRFPIDTLKIDRSFVGRMGTKPENLEIVRAIVVLAQALRMDVVAEGVETAGQLAQLRAMGCGYGQGYFFAKPLDPGAAEALIVAGTGWPPGKGAGA